MTPEIVIVALLVGLAGGAIAGVVMGAIQAWMARPKGTGRERFYTLRDIRPHAPDEAPYAGRKVSTRGVGGMGPFDRFDSRSQRVLALAQDEAIRFNHNYIGTEHILLGLVREGEGVAAQALRELDIPLDKVRTAVEFIIGRGDSTTAPTEITLSPRTKKVIELAIDEARQLGHSYVGPEHLLLGLVREGEGIASGVLESLGVSMPRARQKVLEVLARGDTGQQAAAPGPFDRFDVRAKRVLALAQEEALRMFHAEIGTEHVLLGIARLAQVAGDPIDRIFRELSLTYDQLRAEVVKVLPPQPTPTRASDITLSSAAKQLIEASIAEAGKTQRHQIRPEDFLIVLTELTVGSAMTILASLGATQDRVRNAVDRPGESAA